MEDFPEGKWHGLESISEIQNSCRRLFTYTDRRSRDALTLKIITRDCDLCRTVEMRRETIDGGVLNHWRNGAHL